MVCGSTAWIAWSASAWTLRQIAGDPTRENVVLWLAERATELPLRVRLTWGALWMLQFVAIVLVGRWVHGILANIATFDLHVDLLSAWFVLETIATFTVAVLGANAFLVLACGAVSGRCKLVRAVHRYRLFADLVVAISMTILPM